MKKKLLFIIPSLDAGGGEKSLVNLLNQIDYSKYEVDLFLFSHGGIFTKFLPNEVNILDLSKNYIDFMLPLRKSIINMLKRGKISLILNRLLFAYVNNTKQNLMNIEQYNWKYLSGSLDRLDNQYDVAIAFLEKTSIYYCVEKVNATKKFGFIHNDYDKMQMDSKVDINYFKKLDKILTVSEECLTVLKNRFPSEADKMDIMYNIVSPTMINKMANMENRDLFNRKNKEKIIVSIGRLHYQKGFELAIEACKKLVDNNYKVRWFVIGEGPERDNLARLIRENGLEDKFILLGLKSNPYPYIKQADIYAQTSRFEGKSIALDEAKILAKPIIITNYSTAKDQIDNGIDGIIVDMDSSSICKGIEKLINDIELNNEISSNLKKEKLGTESEINKLYSMIEG